VAPALLRLVVVQWAGRPWWGAELRLWEAVPFALRWLARELRQGGEREELRCLLRWEGFGWEGEALLPGEEAGASVASLVGSPAAEGEGAVVAAEAFGWPYRRIEGELLPLPVSGSWRRRRPDHPDRKCPSC